MNEMLFNTFGIMLHSLIFIARNRHSYERMKHYIQTIEWLKDKFKFIILFNFKNN